MSAIDYLRLDWFSLTDVQPWIEFTTDAQTPDQAASGEWIIRIRRRSRR